MQQLNLTFDEQIRVMELFGTEPRRLVRTNDPMTSHEAARLVDTSKLEGLVLSGIRGYGYRGCTSDELRSRRPFSDHSYSSITARYKALKDKGLIKIIGKRPGDSGRMQSVMVAIF